MIAGRIVKRGGAAFALVAFATIAGGCRQKAPLTEDVPAYRWVDKETAIRDLRARADAVKTVSAECTITLTRADGETVTLDGAIVTRNPGWVRLRAWKFNRAVFDLTLQPAGLWVMTLDDPKRKEQMLPAKISAATFVRQWSHFNGKMFDETDAGAAKIEGNTLVLFSSELTESLGPALKCEVDRRTLTPRRYAYCKPGAPNFELALDEYRIVAGIPWPHRLVATGTMGKIVITQRNVEINGEVAPNAFVPPRRAEKQP